MSGEGGGGEGGGLNGLLAPSFLRTSPPHAHRQFHSQRNPGLLLLVSSHVTLPAR